MPVPRFPWLILLLVLIPRATSAESPRSEPATLTPSIVVAGSPEFLRIAAPGAASIDGEWLGRKIQFFPARDHRTWLALAGVDVEAARRPLHSPRSTSTSPTTPRATSPNPSTSIPRTTAPASSPCRPNSLRPVPTSSNRSKPISKLKEKIFAASAPEPLWSGSFRAPVHAPPTDSFGTRRTFNGKLASIHKGMDFRAPMGTIVRASNSGTVVLARPLYYEGNCVVIDHGLGLYTVSMHFSRIDVHEGQHVAPATPRPQRRHRPRHRSPSPLGRPLAKRLPRPRQAPPLQLPTNP